MRGWITEVRGKHKARLSLDDGTTRNKTFLAKQDALAWLEDQKSAERAGTFIDPRKGAILFSEWVEEWWATRTHLRPTTVAGERGLLNIHLLPKWGKHKIGAITQISVKRWVSELTASGMAPSRVHASVQLLGRIMNSAIDAEMIVKTPVRRIDNLPEIEPLELNVLTPDQIARLSDAIDPRYRGMVLLAAYGGLRMCELAGLKRKRFDTLHGKVSVAEIAVEVRGHIYWGPPKTKASKRELTLPKSVAAELREHVTAYVHDPSPEALIFPGRDGGVFRRSAWRTRFWLPALEAAGLEAVRPHDLRHTAVSLWLKQGVNYKEIARRAGHTNVAFTMQRYGHLYPESDQDAADRMEEIYVKPGKIMNLY